MRRLPLILALGSIGCAPDGAPSPCAPDDRELLVVATTDFAVGAIATLGEDALDDTLAPLGGDPQVFGLADGRVAVLERSGGHHIRLYTPGCWDVPDLEVALGADNPHAAALREGELWVTTYAEPSVRILDAATGEAVDEIALAAHADDDGLPEADRIVLRDDRVWISLQRLKREGAVWPDGGGGKIVAIDPATRDVVEVHDVGPNPKVVASRRGIVVLTGIFGAPDGGFGLLGEDGVVTEIRGEGALGFDLQHYVEVGDVGVLVGVDHETSARSRVRCYDWPTDTLREGPDSDVWYADAVAGPDGLVWLAARSTLDPGVGDGLVAFDPVACAPVDRIETLLEPFSLTVRAAVDDRPIDR